MNEEWINEHLKRKREKLNAEMERIARPEGYGPPKEQGWTCKKTYIAAFPSQVSEPISASSDDGAIFELLAQIGCSMPKKEQEA